MPPPSAIEELGLEEAWGDLVWTSYLYFLLTTEN